MADEPLILAFDTSTPCCSIALTEGGFSRGNVVASLSLCSSITHSRRLLSAIDWLLLESSLSLDDISAVAVGLGPGSFTGLRIAMATAKGLAHGAGKALIGVSSLDVLAASVSSDRLICALLDARKKEVYSCFYRCDEKGIVRRCSEPAVMKPEVLAESINEPVVFAGDGVSVYNDLLVDILGDLMDSAPVHQRYPAAGILGLLANEHYLNSDFLDSAGAAPTYIRASDAELSLVKPKPRT